MVTTWISDLAYMFRELGKDAGWYIFYWIFYNYQKRVDYWNRIVQDCLLIADKISNKADEVVTTVEDWAKERYDNAKDAISPLWESITSLWARFGYDITNTAKTVVDWVKDKVDDAKDWAKGRYDDAKTWATDAWAWVKDKGGEVWDWIRDRSDEVWDWIRDKSGEVWDWIEDKSGDVWDWIVGTGDLLESWQIAYGPFYSDLKDTHQNKLLSFLNDPGRFIADWVADLAEYIVSECVWRFW